MPVTPRPVEIVPRPHAKAEPDGEPRSMPARRVLFRAQADITCREIRRAAGMLRDMHWSTAADFFEDAALQLEAHPAVIEAIDSV